MLNDRNLLFVYVCDIHKKFRNINIFIKQQDYLLFTLRYLRICQNLWNTQP